MPASDVQKTERFDLYVGKLRSICDMHGIRTGSRDDLRDFLRRLEEDRRFSMDFWAFVGKLSNREGGELSDEQTLAVVVTAITGSETHNEDDPQLRPAIDELRALLSGVDLHHMEPMTTARAIVAMQQNPQRPRRFAPAPVPEPANPDTNGTLQTQLEQTIQRLELVNSQLVQSLAYLDERFRRLEAHLEVSPPPQPLESTLPIPKQTVPEQNQEQARPLIEHEASTEASAQDEPVPHPPVPVEEELLLHPAPLPLPPVEAPPLTENNDLLPRYKANDFKPRLVLEPNTPPVEEAPLAANPDKPNPDKTHSQPLFEVYGSESSNSGKKITAGLAIVLLLAGSGFAWHRYSTQIRQITTNLIQKIHPSEIQQQPAPAEAPQSTDTTPGESAPQAASPAEQTAPPATTAPEPEPPAAQPRKTPPEHANIPAPQDAFIADASAVRVPAAVMEKNIIVSRVPAYPEAAKASRVQGSVIVQALITKTGAVSRVHVTQGDTRLRTAAVDAIYRQRYRPYLVNGVPVDVITTITMNFTPGQ
ncbi:MAG: TonB family protein [Edaphobacter sp.]